MTTIKQYLAAQSEFSQPVVIADLRAGLDFAKRLREHLPGDAPELQQADENIAAIEAAIDAAEPESAPLTTCGATRLTYDTEAERIAARASRPEVAAELSELAGLVNVRPDRGASEIIKLACLNIADLRERLTDALRKSPAYVVVGSPIADLSDQLATLRADNDARGVLIEQLRAELAKANRRIATLTAECDRSAAETERQQRLTALFVRVLREMTRGDE